MAPKISITLPSIYPTALARTLRNIRDATRCEHEIIVVSPFNPPDARWPRSMIKWIKDPNNNTGPNAAHELAFKEATGEFVVAMCDDHLFVDGHDVIALKDFAEKEAAHPNKALLFGLRQVYPEQVGTVFGLYYPYFPMMRTKTARALGWFTADYRRGFADCDLAMRVWDAGGICEWSKVGLISVHDDDRRKGDIEACAPGDMETFLARWAPRYGVGWKTDTLRDFNRDYELSAAEKLCASPS